MMFMPANPRGKKCGTHVRIVIECMKQSGNYPELETCWVKKRKLQ